MNLPTREELDAELCKRSFYHFVKSCWHEVDPSPFIDTKYIEVICSHLEWVYETGNDLIINIPPRHAKSLIVSVMFNAWVWARDPSKSFLCATHSASLTLRDSQRARQLIKSKWYVDRFGDVGFASDQDVKSRFVNSSKGSRQSVSVDSGVTGDGADIRIVDDALDASNSTNNNAIDKVNDWNNTTFSTRIKNPNYKPQITVMQRLAPDDLSGNLIEQGKYLLCLPAEFNPKHPHLSNTPKEAYPDGMAGDWRTEKGELLFPELYSEEDIRSLKLSLGTKASGQLNQYPITQDGDIINDSILGTYTASQCGVFDNLIITADTAEKTGKNNAYSVFALYATKSSSEDIYVLDVIRGKYNIIDLNATATAFFNKHKGKRHNGNVSFNSFQIEDKSSGGALITMMRNSGLGVSPISRKSKSSENNPQESGKWQRLDQVANHLTLNMGKILLPSEPTPYTDASWTSDYRQELKACRQGADNLGFWDQADTLSDAGYQMLIKRKSLFIV